MVWLHVGLAKMLMTPRLWPQVALAAGTTTRSSRNGCREMSTPVVVLELGVHLLGQQ